MVINKKKRQPCSGIIQKHDHIQKKKLKSGHMWTLVMRICSVLSNACHGKLNTACIEHC